MAAKESLHEQQFSGIPLSVINNIVNKAPKADPVVGAFTENSMAIRGITGETIARGADRRATPRPGPDRRA